MAAIAHRRPSIRRRLPASLIRAGMLSDAQIERVVLAAEAHQQHLPGRFQVSNDLDFVRRVDGPHVSAPESGLHLSSLDAGDGQERCFGSTVVVRQGFMLAAAIGCGKGRQVAGILLNQGDGRRNCGDTDCRWKLRLGRRADRGRLPGPRMARRGGLELRWSLGLGG